MNRLLGNIDQAAGGEDFAVFALDEVGLLGREEVSVVLADHIILGKPQQIQSRAVLPHVAQRARILDEHHDGQILDQRIEKAIGFQQLGLRIAPRAHFPMNSTK